MRRLEVTPDMLGQHLAAYDDGIMRGLTVLANGLELTKRDMRKRNCYKACDHPLIPACAPKSFELLYVSHVCCFYRYFQSQRGGVLAFSPTMLERSVRQFAHLDRHIMTRFGEKSPEYGAWLDGKEKVKDLFNYDEFSAGKKLVAEKENNTWYFHWEKNPQWGGWHYLKQLHVATCSYCNSDGVFTIEYGGKGRKILKKSELDHFWPRERYPFLGLSLYNLVPSCTRCNRNFKRDELPWGMVQPYRDDFHAGAKFYAVFKDYKGISRPTDTDVDIVIGRPDRYPQAAIAKRAKRSAEFFHLEEVYNQVYALEVADIARKVLYLPETYLMDLRGRYPGVEESVLNRMVLGSSLDPADINKLAHEKLRQDIHSQLWVQRKMLNM